MPDNDGGARDKSKEGQPESGVDLLSLTWSLLDSLLLTGICETTSSLDRREENPPMMVK